MNNQKFQDICLKLLELRPKSYITAGQIKRSLKQHEDSLRLSSKPKPSQCQICNQVVDFEMYIFEYKDGHPVSQWCGQNKGFCSKKTQGRRKRLNIKSNLLSSNS